MHIRLILYNRPIISPRVDKLGPNLSWIIILLIWWSRLVLCVWQRLKFLLKVHCHSSTYQPLSQVHTPAVLPMVQEGQTHVVAKIHNSGSDNSTPAIINKVIPNCKYFLRARCGHGFSGKNQYKGLAKCRFTHPTPCNKLLKHGFFSATSQLGCKFSKSNCQYAHMKMRQASVKSR